MFANFEKITKGTVSDKRLPWVTEFAMQPVAWQDMWVEALELPCR
jgi:hypothetical protein